MAGKAPDNPARLQEALSRLAAGQPLLICGEAGTGKLTLARAVHAASGRQGQFVAAACAGAATLAAFHSEAAGGTLCLRHLEDLAHGAQAELLQLLAVPGDVRLIVTACPAAEEKVQKGYLHAGLWQLLQAERLDVLPLRRRMEELPALAEAILHELGGDAAPGPSTEAQAALLAYHWPGNLTELRGALTHACTVAGNAATLEPEHLPEHVARPYLEAAGESIYERFRSATEGTLLEWCLKDTGGNRVEAAKRLGLSRAGLYKWLNRHNPPNKGEG